MNYRIPFILNWPSEDWSKPRRYHFVNSILLLRISISIYSKKKYQFKTCRKTEKKTRITFMIRTAINVFQLCGNVEGIICSQAKPAIVNTNTIFWFLQLVFLRVSNTPRRFLFYLLRVAFSLAFKQASIMFSVFVLFTWKVFTYTDF